MPFRVRSKNPLVRFISAYASAMAWLIVMAATLSILLPFFGTLDTQAFLAGTKPNSDFQITDLELAFTLVIMFGVNFLFNFLFIRLTRYANRRLQKNIEWENNPMG